MHCDIIVSLLRFSTSSAASRGCSRGVSPTGSVKLAGPCADVDRSQCVSTLLFLFSFVSSFLFFAITTYQALSFVCAASVRGLLYYYDRLL